MRLLPRAQHPAEPNGHTACLRVRRKAFTKTGKHIMTKMLVLYYSMYGHIEIMAKAVAEGVRSANADVVIKRVPDTMSPEAARQYGAKLEQEAPFATPDELPQYDAIIFGTPARFGRPKQKRSVS